ncbi:phosphatase PAP2 family protein [Candidatus Parcubacteria bacterium]|nr:phosphatase PAP2 family protein [Candidatus Parcubacteria bacterium]
MAEKNSQQAIAISIASLVLFVLLAITPFRGVLKNVDLASQTFIEIHRSPALTSFMVIVTNVASPLYLFILSIIFSVLLILFNKTRGVGTFFLSMCAGLIIETILKHFLGVLRPTGGIVHATSGSFPSGHATMATIFFVNTINVVRHHTKHPVLQTLFMAFSVLAILCIAVSRVYLGVHWLTDVFGGVLLGLFCFSATVSVLKKSLSR